MNDATIQDSVKNLRAEILSFVRSDLNSKNECTWNCDSDNFKLGAPFW